MFVNGYYEVGDQVKTGPNTGVITAFSPRGCVITDTDYQDGHGKLEEMFDIRDIRPVWPLKPAPGIYWVQRSDDPEPWLVAVYESELMKRWVKEVIRISAYRVDFAHPVPVLRPSDFPPDTQWWPVVKPEGRKEPQVQSGFQHVDSGSPTMGSVLVGSTPPQTAPNAAGE